MMNSKGSMITLNVKKKQKTKTGGGQWTKNIQEYSTPLITKMQIKTILKYTVQ